MIIKRLLLLLLFWANIVSATNHQFTDFFNNLESLHANFIQNTYSKDDKLLNSASGSVAFNRPKQLRWQTNTPNEQILLLNDNQFWLIDVELEQAVLQQITDLAKTPLYWLINKPSALKNIPIFSHRQADFDWYEANSNSAKYQQLEFAFSGATLSAVAFKNALQQTVVIMFYDVKINQTINPQTFELNLGPAFDIIKE